MRDHTYFVYIMASRSRTLYIGFTSDLRTRVSQHNNDVFDGFSSRYQCHRLVYYESFDYVVRAIAREKQLKRWSRAKKIALIQSRNPAWMDLSLEWGRPIELLQPDAGLSTPAAKDAASGRDDTE